VFSKDLTVLPQRDMKFGCVLATLCFVAYMPAFNNGFISDDYVILERLRALKENFWYLFSIPPDNFRSTTYVFFGLLEAAFGYHSAFFYAFTILVHFGNSVLLGKLIHLVTGRTRTAILAATLFAVFQNPQEAVMWLAGMSDALLGFSVLCALILQLKGRYLLGALAYLAALFSKESALILLPLLVLCEYPTARKVAFRRHYWYLIIPSLVFSILFIYLMSGNVMLSHGLYAFRVHAFLVLGRSFHRLVFPWLYLAILAFVLHARRGPPPALGFGLAWMAIALLPYIFLTYQNHVPSRHEYLASMGLVWALAVVLDNMNSARLRQTCVIAFIIVNIAYIWLVKDAQFERRAAPTSQLLEYLRANPPGRLLVSGFPLNPWIAKMTARLAPGWQPEMLAVDEALETCNGCPKLRWNSKTESYEHN
jgi:hypothetical protein